MPARSHLPADLSRAIIVVSPQADRVERTACRMLVEEAAKRSGLTLAVTTRLPAVDAPLILLGSRERPPDGLAKAERQGGPRRAGGAPASEGFRLQIAPGRVVALGNDSRGCLFAAGRLLRLLRCAPGRLEAASLTLVTAPVKPLRGHQLGWRPTSNTYDRWGLKEYEQYLRDLAIWGTNAIELIPFDPDSDPEKTAEMTARLSDLIASYGMQVWLWFPLDDRVPDGVTGNGLTPGQVPCPSRPDGRRFLLERRQALFQRIRNLDAVFLPGGDPGGCECDLCRPWAHTLLPLAEEIAGLLRATYPDAQFWLSNQGFSEAENRAFYDGLRSDRPKWLTGVVYAPWAEATLEAMRAQIPPDYRLRLYPDITHCVRCQYPARDWDNAFALTLGREPPIYRPTEHAQIVHLTMSQACGALTYSDGVNDDLNKALWSALLWEPKASVRGLLEEYGRVYFGDRWCRRVADGLLGLERNGKAPLRSNRDVEKTLTLWQELERDAPDLRANWRFQMALLRATYDAYVQRKLAHDTDVERRCLAALARYRESEPLRALHEGHEVLIGDDIAVASDLEARLLELGQALYDSIGMQLSVPCWGAFGSERGAILDFLHVPLANQAWLKAEIDRLARTANPDAIGAGIERILHWEDPGPGGFYDDLGDPTRQPHLVRQKSWEEDPGSVESPRCDFRLPLPEGRQAWNHYAETLYGTPLVMRYTGLDPNASYVVRAVYTGRYRPVMTLTANGRYVVHGPTPTPATPAPQEWPVPREATADGTLTLTWQRVTGRGAQVSEVWLLKR